MESRRSRSKKNSSNDLSIQPRKSLPLLPTEIYLTIFSFATSVSQALDTSFDGIQSEYKRLSLIGFMFDCMRMRAKLSSVSKAFHSIMEDLLYELIVTTHFETIPKILTLLRHVPPGRRQPRGHTCRRLDIHIRIRLNQPSDYLDEAWDVGRNTLWGLLSTCPNLQVLTARITYMDNDPYNSCLLPHLGHNALCKTISTYCASTLRRLELSGFDIPMDRVEMMLRYMSELEACTISDCRAFNNIHNVYKRSDFFSEFCDARAYDENEDEKVFEISTSCEKVQKKTRLVKSTVFSAQMVKEFYDAREYAQWPQFQGSPPYQLPKLHSFHLDKLTERIFEFHLPTLRSLSTNDVVHRYVLFNTNLVPDVQNSTSTTMISGLPNERPSKYDIHPNYRHRAEGPHYTNPIPHSTPFGIFPTTITHVTMAFHMNLARILYFFPNIINLTWYIERAWGLPVEKTPYWKPHRELRHITIRDYNSRGATFEADTQEVIHGVVKAVKDGWLLSLTNLVLASRPQYKCAIVAEDLMLKECGSLGIKLSVVEISELHDLHSTIQNTYD